MASFAERLKELRLGEKLSQVSIAQIAGITDRGIRHFESGESLPNLAVLLALADHFNCSLDYLCGRSDTRERQP